MHRTDKYSQHSSIIWPVWLNGWVFVYELNGCGFESRCSHLNFRFRACFEQGVPWHSGNYRVWIHSETRTWHDKNIQSIPILCYLLCILFILCLTTFLLNRTSTYPLCLNFLFIPFALFTSLSSILINKYSLLFNPTNSAIPH